MGSEDLDAVPADAVVEDTQAVEEEPAPQEEVVASPAPAEEQPADNGAPEVIPQASSIQGTPQQKGGSKIETPRKTTERAARPASAAKVPAFSPIYLGSPRTAQGAHQSVRATEEFTPQPKSPEAVAAIAEAVARRAVIPASGKGGAPRPHPIMPMSNPDKPKPSPPKAPSHKVPPKPAPRPLTSGAAPEAAKPFAERAPQFVEAKKSFVERPQSAKPTPTSPGVKFASARPKSARLASENSTASRQALSGPLPEKAAIVTDRLYTVSNGTARQDQARKPKPRPILAGSGNKAPPRPLPPVPKNARVSPPSNRRRIIPSGRPSKATIAHQEQEILDKEKEIAKVELDSKLEAARARTEGDGKDEVAEPTAVEA